jgi:hypothetical protein
LTSKGDRELLPATKVRRWYASFSRIEALLLFRF